MSLLLLLLPVMLFAAAASGAVTITPRDKLPPRGKMSPQLRELSEAALALPVQSVTQKQVLAPSGDVHDYASIGIYWWPDPDQPDGLPWVRRDGQINPQTRAGSSSDSGRLRALTRAVSHLTCAWHLTGDGRYAAHAAVLLRGWFLDDATRMNPNLNHGQGVPGRSIGRPYGIIETHQLLELFDAAARLEASAAWNEDDAAGLRRWAGGYRDWLLNSDLGREEATKVNNHGTWYDAQVLWLSAFAGDPPSDDAIRAALARHLARIEPDGRQPHELQRTKSLSYSVFNLLALAHIARLAETRGLKSWHAHPKLAAALDFITPHLLDHSAWPHEQLGEIDADHTCRLLILAGFGLDRPDLLDLATRLNPGDQVSLLELNLPTAAEQG
jgi:hypothetical protein